MVGIIYRPPTQNNLLGILNKNFPSIDTDFKETHILGDLNINIYENSKYFAQEHIQFARNLHLLMLNRIISFVQCTA